MSNTKLQYHLVFSTKDRRPQIHPEIKPRLFKFIGGIIRKLDGRLLAIDGPEDHIHIAAILTPKRAIMDCLREMKCISSKWIHETFPEQRDFRWQDGYAAFTVSHSAMPRVIKYIEGQSVHHRKKSFQEELIALLQRHDVEYDARYIWK